MLTANSRTSASHTKCGARKRDGNPCLRPPLAGGSWCYRHSFFRWTGVPFLKNGTIHLVVALTAFFLLSLSIRSYFNQDWLVLVGDLKEGMDRVESLRTLLERTAEAHRASLRTAYPLGYLLFAVDGQGHMVPQDLEPEAGLGADWDSLRVVQVTAKEISLTPPTVYFEDGTCQRSGTVVVMPRPVGPSVSLCPLAGGEVFLSLLHSGEDGMVFVIGLAEDRLPPIFSRPGPFDRSKF